MTLGRRSHIAELKVTKNLVQHLIDKTPPVVYT